MKTTPLNPTQTPGGASQAVARGDGDDCNEEVVDYPKISTLVKLEELEKGLKNEDFLKNFKAYWKRQMGENLGAGKFKNTF